MAPAAPTLGGFGTSFIMAWLVCPTIDLLGRTRTIGLHGRNLQPRRLRQGDLAMVEREEHREPQHQR